MHILFNAQLNSNATNYLTQESILKAPFCASFAARAYFFSSHEQANWNFHIKLNGGHIYYTVWHNQMNGSELTNRIISICLTINNQSHGKMICNEPF